MNIHHSRTVIPNYDVDEFVIYTLRLMEFVKEGPTDPLMVQGKHAHKDPVTLEVVSFDRPMDAVEIAEELEKICYRPADYGEFRGFWDDNVPKEIIMIIPSDYEMTNRIWFQDQAGNPLALVLAPRDDQEGSHFATTSLAGKFPEYMRFLVTKK